MMHNGNVFKKGIFISLMSVSLLFSFNSVSLADEMGGMNMGGSSMQQTAPVESHATSEHEAMPGMDPNMEGMQGSGHGESSESSVGVNWIVVGGFLVINTLIIISAGVLKSKKAQPQL